MGACLCGFGKAKNFGTGPKGQTLLEVHHDTTLPPDVYESCPTRGLRSHGPVKQGGRWYESLDKLRKAARLRKLDPPKLARREPNFKRPMLSGKPKPMADLPCLGYDANSGRRLPPMGYCADRLFLYHQIDGDNSCMFNAVRTGVGDNLNKNASQLRKGAILDYIGEVPDEHFQLNIPDEFKGKGKDAYKNFISQPHAWGGPIELQILAKFYYGVQICVVSVRDGHMHFFPEEAPPSNRRIYILFTGAHYDCVMPLDEAESKEHAGLFFADDFDTQKQISECANAWAAVLEDGLAS